MSARVGVAVPSDAYQRACGASSLAFGVDLQGGGRVFPQLLLEHFTGSGGADVACIPIAPSEGSATGGLQLDGATRLGVGGGARLERGPVRLEGVILTGIIAGPAGFPAPDARTSTRTAPHAGAQAALVLFRHLVLSAGLHWTRLTLDVARSDGRTSAERTWKPMVTAQMGGRLPLGRRSAR